MYTPNIRKIKIWLCVRVCAFVTNESSFCHFSSFLRTSALLFYVKRRITSQREIKTALFPKERRWHLPKTITKEHNLPIGQTTGRAFTGSILSYDKNRPFRMPRKPRKPISVKWERHERWADRFSLPLSLSSVHLRIKGPTILSPLCCNIASRCIGTPRRGSCVVPLLSHWLTSVYTTTFGSSIVAVFIINSRHLRGTRRRIASPASGLSRISDSHVEDVHEVVYEKLLIVEQSNKE